MSNSRIIHNRGNPCTYLGCPRGPYSRGIGEHGRADRAADMAQDSRSNPPFRRGEICGGCFFILFFIFLFVCFLLTHLLTYLRGARIVFLVQGPSSLVSPLLACMQDKNAGARLLAQDCLSELVAGGTVQPSRVIAATRDFQPAVMRQLKPALDKIIENQGARSRIDYSRERRSVSDLRAGSTCLLSPVGCPIHIL